MERLKINLLTKPNFESLLPQVEDFIENHKSELTFEHQDYKVGQEVTFLGGYNKDIIYTSKIFAFCKETGKAYVYWDCYWFSIELKERQV